MTGNSHHRNEQMLKEITDSFSFQRIEAYRLKENDCISDLLGRSLWNTALSQSLYTPLEKLEVCLRNSIHKSLKEAYLSEHWFESKFNILKERELQKVNEAKQNLQRKMKPFEAGRIIAELNFGFWTSLFNAPYNQILWPRLLKKTFPYIPKYERTQNKILKKLQNIRELRNRVFHYEPIWQWNNLPSKHKEILDIIGWLNPNLLEITKLFDQFENIYEEGSMVYTKKLQKNIFR